MSIRFRLLLSYIAMLIMPIVLFFFAALILAIAFSGDFRTVIHDYVNPSQSMNDAKSPEQSLQVELNQALTKNPDAFLSKQTTQEWDHRFNAYGVGLVVMHGDQIIYASRNLPTADQLNELYQKAKSDNNFLNNKLSQGVQSGFHNAHNMYPYGQITFRYKDQSVGNVFIIRDPTPVGVFIRKFLTLLLFALLGILVLTNGTLTYLVSRSILRPLNKLKQSIEQIKEGNLDHEVKVYSSDEIGQLCSAFDEMRHKLKESVDVQLQYEENRKELISNISHDLRTPVTAIKGYVEGIKDGVADTPEKFDKYIQTIYAKATDLDRLIDELFLFSRLDLKKVPFHFEKVDLVAFLRDILDEFQLDHREVTFSFEHPFSAPIYVTADREKLKRVISNIVGNSLNYIDQETGAITVRMFKEAAAGKGPSVTVEIEDNGQGIDPSALPFIFERFYRGDPSRNTRSGGSGLGLAISKQIIEEHGGDIWAASERGTGTVISVRLRTID